ncbi:MAG: histidinol phosphatase or family hydrolase [Firmicutes bacterium]|nr:histidinol phosphatase or family hydrolase [Bacillota bacterium]
MFYLLEHTHQFSEFKQVYQPIARYNNYQFNWLYRKMGGSIANYLTFIKMAKKRKYPIEIKFGLEVCYIPQTEDLLGKILREFNFDFLTGSVHYIDNWGFDHKAEFWNEVNVNNVYKRYYEIMIDLIQTGLFDGLTHPDSIKCFKHYPTFDQTELFTKITTLLNKHNMYVEQSGGLALNYGCSELGMNQMMLKILKNSGVRIMTASDAHKPEHTGTNIYELQQLIDNV